MRILTFDTSADKMFVTIGTDSHIEVSKIVENTAQRYHSALMIPVIIELLQKLNLTMQNIDVVGVNIGPGSFTGIRASATVARTMGQNLDIPIIGISSLEIYSCLNKTDKDSLILLDAKKGKAYIGVYSSKNDTIRQPSVLEYEEVINYAQNNDFVIIADNVMAEKIKEAGLEVIDLKDVNCDFGIFLAKLTYKHSKSGNLDKYKWFNLKPLYIQPPPITMPKGSKPAC